MKKNELGFIVKKDSVLIGSRVVAEKLEKQHFHVLAKIEEVLNASEFCAIEYVDSRGRKQPEYMLTRDGFTLLCMNYTGYNDFKRAYVAEFNRMEDFIREKQSSKWIGARAKGKQTRRAETDTIKDKLIPLAISQGSTNYNKLYMTYSLLINSLLGINSDMRDKLPWRYIVTIDLMENIIENIIADECDKGTHYKDIYCIVKTKCQIAVDLAFLPKLDKI